MALGRGLRGRPRAEPRLRPPLSPRPHAPAPPHPGCRERGVGDDGHLSQRLGPGPGAGLCVLGPGEHRGQRVPGVAHHRPVEPRRHRRRSGRHLAALGAFIPRHLAGQRVGLHGSLRPPLRHPDGRCGDGAEGEGRGLDAAERGPVPLVDPELLRHDRRARREGAHLVRQPGGDRAARVRAGRAGRTARHRPRPPRRPRVRAGPVRSSTAARTRPPSSSSACRRGTAPIATSKPSSPISGSGPPSAATSPTCATSPSARSSRPYWPTRPCTIRSPAWPTDS